MCQPQCNPNVRISQNEYRANNMTIAPLIKSKHT